jgi:hypothetical protein
VLTHLAGALHDLGKAGEAEHMCREALDIADGQGNPRLPGLDTDALVLDAGRPVPMGRGQ